MQQKLRQYRPATNVAPAALFVIVRAFPLPAAGD